MVMKSLSGKVGSKIEGRRMTLMLEKNLVEVRLMNKQKAESKVR